MYGGLDAERVIRIVASQGDRGHIADAERNDERNFWKGKGLFQIDTRNRTLLVSAAGRGISSEHTN